MVVKQNFKNEMAVRLSCAMLTLLLANLLFQMLGRNQTRISNKLT
jgi:hypothetical protein